MFTLLSRAFHMTASIANVIVLPILAVHLLAEKPLVIVGHPVSIPGVHVEELCNNH